MTKWEYKIEEFSTSGVISGLTKIGSHLSFEKTESWSGKEKLEKTEKPVKTEDITSMFNKLGSGGWELVGVLPLAGRTGFGESATAKVDFIFKRQIQ